ncbi:unnamed protein product, partial [Thelazia callipaeda]|uniref:Serine carboxypeptidase n=1 Tax=Thelazia callipaeda TaxID=103827 RepID=A0A0N5CQN5_THECL
NVGGFPCYIDHAINRYLSLPDVREALHVPNYVQSWSLCSFDVGEHYIWEHSDMSMVFQEIFELTRNSGHKFRILIYNGDTDLACPILEAQCYSPQIGGYLKEFKTSNDLLTITVSTVKGAGHMVPTDRAGPMAQLMSNFLDGSSDWDKPFPYPVDRKPLITPYTEVTETTTQSTVTTQTKTTGSTTTSTTTEQPKGCRRVTYYSILLVLILLPMLS